MKSLITTLIMLLAMTVIGQVNCSKYYPFGEGTISEYEMLNKKNKPEGTFKYTVNKVSNSVGITTATINSELFDKKGNAVMSSEFDMSCDGNAVSMDFKSMMNAGMIKQFQNSEVEMTGTNMDVPNNLSPGQNLPDAGIKVTVNMSGITMNMTTDITDRKVANTETITTPAGMFDCVVITQSSSGKMMMARFNSTQKTWLAEGVGMVKTEDYNKNGKLQSTTVLTSFSN